MFVGARVLGVRDPTRHVTFEAYVFYPTAVKPTAVRFGAYQAELSLDAPVGAHNAAIVVISHGTGGTPLGYLDLCRQLALAGYVVVCPRHAGNNHLDDTLADTTENLQRRPHHVSLCVDAAAALMREPHGFVVVGHSMGGYTALAVAGGKPATGPGQPVDVHGDDRVCGVVLLAPAVPWFQGPGALSGLSVPVRLYTAEHDPHTPPWHGQVVVKGLASGVLEAHIVVPGAGHFSFMSPFPAEMATPDFLPAQDPPGFDRRGFQQVLGDEILHFIADTVRC